METNELPEDVKRNISLAAVDSTIHQTKTDLWAIDMMQLFFKKGAEFGYRLGLQEIADLTRKLAEIDIKYRTLLDEAADERVEKVKLIESLRKELKAKDEEIAKLTGAYGSLRVQAQCLIDIARTSTPKQFSETMEALNDILQALPLLTETKPE